MAELNTLGADMETAMQARPAAQRSAHLAAMGASFTDAQKQAVSLALVENQLYGILAADYTLTSTTATQQLFNWSAGGALTLTTGLHYFETSFFISSMDATSGNAKFDVKGAGTATLLQRFQHIVGSDTTNITGPATMSGGMSITGVSGASGVSAAVNTCMAASVWGQFDVTVAGTIVPSIALVTAAAAVVSNGSFFRCRRFDATGSNTRGTWT